MIIYTDGACSGNPGPMGIGFIILKEGKELFKFSNNIGLGTNNIAEYTAIIEGVKKAIELGAKGITVRSDSQLVVRQLNGQYRVKNQKLKELKNELLSLLPKDLEIVFENIPREKNKIADKLSKDALE